jgi:betaine lipid synthase
MLSLANAQSLLAGIVAAALSTLCLTSVFSSKSQDEAPGLIKSFFLFFYSSFLKPHQGDSKGNQQDALESFYKKQAGAYDATRKVLLRGREDMLALVAAQMQAKLKDTASKNENKTKRIWVDVSRVWALDRSKQWLTYQFVDRRRYWFQH